MQSRNEALRVFVRHQKEKEGRTYVTLARNAGVSKAQFSRWVNGKDVGEVLLSRLEQLYSIYK